ncbi:MAG: hypothetical protein EON58_19440 [Alphaproteobacteria bacterium]|nr:MAG: hypothetical protein EON58_19440 [Alphaproteobacteria bacterium]
MKSGDVKGMLRAAKEAVKVCERECSVDPMTTAKAYDEAAVACVWLGDIHGSLKYLFGALSVGQQISDLDGLHSTIANIAELHYQAARRVDEPLRTASLERALAYYDQAASICKAQRDIANGHAVRAYAALVKSALGRYKEAKHDLRDTIAWCEENDSGLLALALNNLGVVLLDSDASRTRASKVLTRAKKLAKEAGDTLLLGTIEGNLVIARR